MDISLDNNQGNFLIQSYKDGCLIINGASYDKPIMLGLDFLQQNSLPTSVQLLNKQFLHEIEIKKYEAIIIGTGSKLIFPEWDLLEQAQLMGKSLDVMATDAACRTFTVLASEGRHIIGILYP